MPSWTEIESDIGSVDPPHRRVRREYLEKLHKKTGRNVISYYSSWLQKPHISGYPLSINDHDKNGFMATIHKMNCSKGLDLILHTPGGDIAATESLVDYLHQMFEGNIRAIIPHMAMSAGTMIACACKAILMGKHSSIGPIDPQVGGIPAHEVKEAFEKAKNSKTDQEYTIWLQLLSQWGPTIFGQCEKATKWSKLIVEEWLKKYMFKGEEDSKDKITKIISYLGNPEETFAHNRHVSPVKAKELGLNIESMEEDQKLQDIILSIHHASIITLAKTRTYKIIENHMGTSFLEEEA